MLDPRHTCPNTYQCFDPVHFSWTEWFVPTLIRWTLPKTRPMDDVKAGWDRPQEDEFALANLGVPSPYLVWAFPNHGPVADEYLDLALAARSRARGLEAHVARVRAASGAVRQRPHRAEVAHAHGARAHDSGGLSRGASSCTSCAIRSCCFRPRVRLWKSLSEVQGLQVPRDNSSWLERQVLDTFVRMYERFEQDRELVPRGQLVDVRYEDLVADPVDRMREIYRASSTWAILRDVEPLLMRYTMKTRDYRTNQYALPPEVADRVRGRWAPYFQRYGYNGHEAASASA